MKTIEGEMECILPNIKKRVILTRCKLKIKSYSITNTQLSKDAVPSVYQCHTSILITDGY